jgi:hypothetical protein
MDQAQARPAGSERADPRAGLIVNADDYGFTPAVSAGIRAAHNEGIVTSTTVLILAPSARADLRLAKSECPGLGIGVHLALTGGWRPLLGRTTPTLGNYRRRLPSSADLVRVLSRVNPDEVRAEWQAQIEAVTKAGVDPDHLDAHHNVAYRSEKLFEVLLELAAEHALPVRLPVSPRTPAGASTRTPAAAPLLPGEQLRKLASAHGIAHPDRLLDGFGSGATTEGLIGLLGELPATELAELMCHPGNVDWRLRARSSYTGGRAKELAILTDDRVRQAIEARSIRLTRFARA